MTWGHLNWAIYCGASGSGMGTPIWKKSLPCALPCLESFLDTAGSNFGSATLICLDPFLDLSGSIFGSGSIFRSVWIPFWIWLDPSLDLDQIMDLAGSIFGSGWIKLWIWKSGSNFGYVTRVSLTEMPWLCLALLTATVQDRAFTKSAPILDPWPGFP